MADQDDELRAIVRRMVVAGDSDDDIAKAIARYRHANLPPVQPQATPEGFNAAPGGRSSGGYDVRKSDAFARDNAPAIGATLAATAAPATGGASLLGLAPILAAGAGGYAGSRLRGDDSDTAAWEGTKQAALQGAPRIIGGLSKAVYKSGVPQQVLQKFRQADVAGAGLDARAVLGTTQGVNAALRGSAKAAEQVKAAAPSVEPMFAKDIAKAFAQRADDAAVASRPGSASEIAEYVKQSVDEIGPFPQRGQEQLLRKQFLQPDAEAAMRTAKLATSNPELANIERRAITANLRRSPTMATALDAAQANKGLTAAAKAQEFSTPLTRLRQNGVWDAMHMPLVSSAMGIAGNEVARMADPTLVRLLSSLMSQRSNEQD